MTGQAAPVRQRRIIRRFSREGALLVVLILLSAGMARLSPYFFSVSNLLATTRLFTESALIALGMTLVVITGGIDISVGSIMALASVTLGLLYEHGIPLLFGIACAIAVGSACGFANGLLVTRLRLHPLAITLGTLSLYSGLAYGIAGTNEITNFPRWFEYLGQYYVGPVPGQLIILVLAGAAVALLLSKTRVGRYIYAVGSNERAVEIAGIRPERIKVIVYTITGFLTGLAAVIYTSRVYTARADAGTDIELPVIAAVVLGGASIYGGTGSIAGTSLGVLILAVLQNGFILANIDGNWAEFAIGVTVIAGVLANQWLARRE